MKVKYGVIFFIAHILLNLFGSIIFYSWTAFGGRNSINIIQKMILFFFESPSKYLGLDSLIIEVSINALFWSIVFLLFRSIFIQLYKP